MIGRRAGWQRTRLAPLTVETGRMRTVGYGLACLLLCSLMAGCGYRLVRDAGPKPSPAPTPPDTIVATRGTSMPLKQALRTIAFRPFMPPYKFIDVGVLPVLRGDEDQKGKPNPNWGIGLEYRVKYVRYALSQWPLNGAGLGSASGRKIEQNGCSMTLYKPDGVLWVSRRAIAVTLQADNTMPPELKKEEGSHATPSPKPTYHPAASTKDVIAEARRLVVLGACN